MAFFEVTEIALSMSNSGKSNVFFKYSAAAPFCRKILVKLFVKIIFAKHHLRNLQDFE